MIKLDYKIVPRTVILHIIAGYYPGYPLPGAPHSDTDALFAKAKQLDKATFDLLRDGADAANFTNVCASKQSTLLDIGKRIDQLVQTLQQEAVAASILDQTAKALSDVRTEWEHNYFKSHEILSELIGLPLDRTFQVFMTHPSVAQGFNDFRGNIFWTYRLTFPNYNTIYLWHEIMHYYVDNEHKYSESVAHSVVELLADEELRVRLNGEDYLPLVGHPHLRQSVTLLLPSWQSYTKQRGKKNINEFIEQADQLLKKNDHKKPE
jgi:hypothetical protein